MFDGRDRHICRIGHQRAQARRHDVIPVRWNGSVARINVTAHKHDTVIHRRGLYRHPNRHAAVQAQSLENRYGLKRILHVHSVHYGESTEQAARHQRCCAKTP
jgi:hypothetical protein